MIRGLAYSEPPFFIFYGTGEDMKQETVNRTPEAGTAKNGNLGALAFQIFCALIFLGMIGMVFANAMLRYCFNSGYPPSEEWARFLFIYITFFGAIEAFYYKKHIAVDMVLDLLHGVSKKTVIIQAHLLTIFALIVLLQGGVVQTLQSLDSYAVATHINMSIIYCTLPIMAAAAILLQLRDLLNVLRTPASEFKREEKDPGSIAAEVLAESGHGADNPTEIKQN